MGLASDLDEIRSGIVRLAGQVAQADHAKPELSGWSVGQHIEHVAKVDAMILDRCLGVNVEDPTTQGISLLGRFCLLVGWIPRGRATSPAPFVATDISPEQLSLLVGIVAQRLAHAGPELERHARQPIAFAHPVFGGLDRRQWLRFLLVHQNHHRKIIRDLLR